jgi:CheY-like chemotaxis protein
MLKMKPDLIILDEMLEDLSAGFRFAKKLWERERKTNHIHIPIIMITNIQKVTGLDFKNHIGTPLLSIDGFLEKPVEPEQLLKKIENSLN